MFKKGDRVVRVGSIQGYTLDDIDVGEEATVLEMRFGDSLFDLGENYACFFETRDFKLADEVPAFDSEAVKAFRDKLDAVYALPRDMAFIQRVTEILAEFTALKSAIEAELPKLQDAVEEAEDMLSQGEFTVEQLQKLIAIAKITDLEGKFMHGDGPTEDLKLNHRGAIRPPVDTWQAGDTLDIEDISVSLKAAPAVYFTTEQSIALLKSL